MPLKPANLPKSTGFFLLLIGMASSGFGYLYLVINNINLKLYEYGGYLLLSKSDLNINVHSSILIIAS